MMAPEAAFILQAHGGAARWEALQALDVELSAWGFLFSAKRIPVRPFLRLTLRVQSMEVTLHDYPLPAERVVVLADGTVQWWNALGALVQERAKPREQFHNLRRQLYWDALDFAYFCGYAMWNYLTMPRLLSRSDAASVVVMPKIRRGWHHLRVTFAPQIVTHSREQSFYFDDQWHLCRHDYTAEVVGNWAHAAHLSADYQSFDGLQMPTRRRVYPTLWGSGPLPWPTLVGLDIRAVVPR